MEKQSSSSSSNITEQTSPTQSFSSCSSEFEFQFEISLSPNNNNNNKNRHFCPADEIFYRGKLLPLHHSPRITMLRNIHLSSSTSTVADGSRGSSACSSPDLQFFNFSDIDSSRSSSVTEDDKVINFNRNLKHPSDNFAPRITKNKFLSSFSIFPKVFCAKSRKFCKKSCTKMLGFSARDSIRKYLKKLKPLYEKIGSFTVISTEYAVFGLPVKTEECEKKQSEKLGKCDSSCSSSINSSPIWSCKDSSVKEKQSDIQSAITHCKNSMLVSRN